MIEKDFDIAFIGDLALREKQIQQNYRPVIAVHKWFARRPGTLFRGLLLSEFAKEPLKDAFYRANSFPGCHVADPFMGGGIPVLEANRTGCNVTGFDINPMAWWIVKQEIEHINLGDYEKNAELLRATLENEIGRLYRTVCTICGSKNAHVKYFLWVKVLKCRKCGKDMDLFPGYLLAADSRHPKNVFICPTCGELTESNDRKSPGKCNYCSTELVSEGPAKRGKCMCPSCGTDNSYLNPKSGPPRHRLFAIEYHCQKCKLSHKGRFFKKPDTEDINRTIEAETRWNNMAQEFVPNDKIPSGDETNRLHRWGYTHYKEMFNQRQLVGLELSASIISKISNERIRNALATNLSDLLRYQNMLCRYDTRALKSLDIFSVHGFPVGLIQCESNLLGIMESGRSMCVGSGGWANIIEKYRKAMSYCAHPFEIRHNGHFKKVIPIQGERIGDNLNGDKSASTRIVNLSCQDAASSSLTDSTLDAVLTDPPYFGNVQYAELMDFCYVWLRKIVGRDLPEFKADSTRTPGELTGNVDMGRGLDHFTEGLSSVFQRMAKALKPGSPMAFTYHHNNLEAYFPVAVAILDAGLTCSASLPCPAEMGASIHINGTGSSIIDTVFVCRQTGTMQRKWLAESPVKITQIVEDDLALLRAGNIVPTQGDIRCITYGHMVRLAIWSLRNKWDKSEPTMKRIKKVKDWLNHFNNQELSERHIDSFQSVIETNSPLLAAINESAARYGDNDAEIPF